MTSPNPACLTRQEAHQLLKQFDCLHPRQPSPAERQPIRQAVLRMAEESDYQMLGVCADSVEQGAIALQQYATTLGYQPTLSLTALEGPAYLKFNPITGLCYANPYTGPYRGVLISYQSEDAEDVNEMYGHLPLDLFAEDKISPSAAG